jgi:hypothetical protein
MSIPHLQHKQSLRSVRTVTSATYAVPVVHVQQQLQQLQPAWDLRKRASTIAVARAKARKRTADAATRSDEGGRAELSSCKSPREPRGRDGHVWKHRRAAVRLFHAFSAHPSCMLIQRCDARFGHSSAAAPLVSQATGAPGGNNPFARPQQNGDQPFFQL